MAAGKVSVRAPAEVLLAWSGGKDSALALAALRADPAWRVVGLLTTITREYDRISIHGVRRTVLDAQVAALGLPLFEATIPAAASNAAYEAAFAEALATARARRPGLRHIAFGDLFLADVRAYREALLGRLDWTGVFPLWGTGHHRPGSALRGPRATGRSSPAWTPPSSAPTSREGSSMPHCWPASRPGSIPAASGASSTPACTPAPSSTGRCLW